MVNNPYRTSSFSSVEIVSCPLAGFDKNIYPCCSAIDYKFTQAEMRRNGISRLNTEKRGLKQVNTLVKTMVYIDKNSEG
jgi:hypothetical protein